MRVGPPAWRAGCRTIRGATAATSGSSKWPSSGASHPSSGTQSESTNATSALSTAANPALRAPAGPTLVSSPTKRAPCRSAISLVAPASVDASSTTTQAKPAQRAEQSVERERSVAHRHHDGDIPGSELPPSGRGENAPAETSRRASIWAPRPGPTGAPALQRSTSRRARSEIRKRRSGLPPSSTVPPSNSRVDVSSPRVKDPGSGVEARDGAGRSGEGIPGTLGWGTAQSWQSRAGDRLGPCPEEVGMLVEDQDTQDIEELSDEDVDELLVEEVSIDGMCGVY